MQGKQGKTKKLTNSAAQRKATKLGLSSTYDGPGYNKHQVSCNGKKTNNGRGEKNGEQKRGGFTGGDTSFRR